MLDFENNILQIGLDFSYSIERGSRAPRADGGSTSISLSRTIGTSSSALEGVQAHRDPRARSLQRLGVLQDRRQRHQSRRRTQARSRRSQLRHRRADGDLLGQPGHQPLPRGVRRVPRGLQISPFQLQGSIEVGGELSLIILAIGVRGRLALQTPDPFVLEGEICGKLRFFFFTIEACADFRLGDSPSEPAPPEPWTSWSPSIDFMAAACRWRMCPSMPPSTSPLPETSSTLAKIRAWR